MTTHDVRGNLVPDAALAALAMTRRESPFAEPIRSLPRGAHRVAPELVAEIAFAAWTAARRLRQPRFLGLRDDKPPGTVVAKLTRSHPLPAAARLDAAACRARRQECGTVCGTMAVAASEARRNLFPLIEQVNADRAPVEITSRRGHAVLMSLADYESLQETAYLLRAPANARRLLEALRQSEEGQRQAHPLAE